MMKRLGQLAVYLRTHEGEEYWCDAKYSLVLYDCGVQHESDGNCMLIGWDEIAELKFEKTSGT